MNKPGTDDFFFRKTSSWRIALWPLLCLPALLLSQNFVPGQTYVGANGYVEYRAGNLPIIISAPHGGDLAPGAIPDRTCPDAVTLNDANTQALARQLNAC